MKIIIADDHPIYIEALGEHVKRIFGAVTVIEANRVDQLMQLMGSAADVDLIILDYCMPGMQGVGSVRDIVKAARSVPVVVVSGMASPEDVASFAALGAAGFVPKTTDPKVLEAALTLIAAGETCFPLGTHQRSGRDGTSNGLSPREQIILEAIVNGKSNKEIGRMLGLQEGTIKGDVSRLFAKMNVKNRSQAVALAVRDQVARTKGEV